MSKPLFDDVGQELKEIAAATARRITVMYALLAIAVLAGGFMLSEEMGAMMWGVLGIIAAICVFVHGYNKAHLEVIQLYAYGELVHRVTSLEAKLVGKKATTKKAKSFVSAKEGTPLAKRSKDGSWQCAYCDHRNPAGADWCEECGVEALFE